MSVNAYISQVISHTTTLPMNLKFPSTSSGAGFAEPAFFTGMALVRYGYANPRTSGRLLRVSSGRGQKGSAREPTALHLPNFITHPYRARFESTLVAERTSLPSTHTHSDLEEVAGCRAVVNHKHGRSGNSFGGT